MVLFSLSLDPIIRYMCACIGPQCTLRAYCDDLALATVNIVASLRVLDPIFHVMHKVCNLRMSPVKTQVSTFVESAKFRIHDLTESSLRRYSGLILRDFVLYLGVHIGPGASSAQWAAPVDRFFDAVRDIIALGLGLYASVPLYNMLAFSRIAWLASIASPSNSVVQAETKALQWITRGPWQAFPSYLVKNLKAQLGFNMQAQCITCVSYAARTRSALQTSRTYHCNIATYNNMFTDDDRVLKPLLREWIGNSIIGGLQEAVVHTTPLRATIDPHGPAFQRTLARALSAAVEVEEFETLISRRWSKALLAAELSTVARRSSRCIKELVKLIKPSVVFALLKFWLNAICTSRRFHNEIDACPLCGSSGSDTIEHLCICPWAHDAASYTWIRPIVP